MLQVACSVSISHLRNKFHFSEVHGSMNATGQVHEIHLLYLHRFCQLFVEFLFKSCK